MRILIHFVVLIGIYKASDGAASPRCDLTLQKDGNTVLNGADAVGIGGELNQIYCKALCSGPGSPPALKWYKQPTKRPISFFRRRVYQVRTTFERVSILTIRNMLYSDTATYTCRGWLRGQGWIERSFRLAYGCEGSDHMCDSSRCISETKICDGKTDCRDGTDEQHCAECKANQFRCGDGDCLSAEVRCDGYFDCVDGSDEYECGCLPDFTCEQGGCVSMDKVCDGNYDCLVGEDEVNCTYCKEDEFHCGQKICIVKEQMCNGEEECPDGSDETDCPIVVEIDRPVQEVEEGETVRYTCSAVQSSRRKPYDLTWRRVDGDMSSIARADDGTLVIPDVEWGDAGEYVCTGSDGQTSDEAVAELSVVERCADGFECSNGTCVSTNLVCDFVADCEDGGDEIGCSYCADDEFYCGGTQCIESEAVCDGYDDCASGIDEVGCCVDGFECLDGTCLDSTDECDGYTDCSTGEDEINCTYCAIDEFHCGYGVCIPDTEICDRFQQCEDGSDEQDCGCFEDEFTCSDDTCIPLTKVCDGSIDCNVDGEDESNCGPKCEANQMQCINGECVNDTYVCDHVNDCPLGDDEVNCTCYQDSFHCDDSQCVDKSAICNGTFECLNGKDEDGCPTTCSPGSEYSCGSSDQCIPLPWRCDGNSDCNDGSDECGCAEIEFKCDNGMCINNSSRCDGLPDCTNEEDEKDCTEKVCIEGQILCDDKSACITNHQVCDGSNDCDDKGDESEEKCGTTDAGTTSLNIAPVAAGKIAEADDTETKSFLDVFYDTLIGDY